MMTDSPTPPKLALTGRSSGILGCYCHSTVGSIAGFAGPVQAEVLSSMNSVGGEVVESQTCMMCHVCNSKFLKSCIARCLR